MQSVKIFFSQKFLILIIKRLFIMVVTPNEIVNGKLECTSKNLVKACGAQADFSSLDFKGQHYKTGPLK